ncbi:MAG: hypothetical protein NXH85_17595 [Pseudomonadaceae bacterium]|nr:hypothetical protein [Pseudomonadaceae bacterium]
MPISTLIVQSHRQPLPEAWLGDCIASVRRYAADNQFTYEFVDDALFEGLPQAVLDNTSRRLSARSDLARLRLMQARLDAGYDRVLWLDADILLFAPQRLSLPDEPFAVGRECWLTETEPGRVRCSRAVHNAALFFTQGNPLLPFYQHAAEALLVRHDGDMVPQLAGPKFLTLLHNAIAFPVIESVGMLSPRLAYALLADEFAVIDAFRRRHPERLAGFNLCASLAGEMPPMKEIIDRLQDRTRWPGEALLI